MVRLRNRSEGWRGINPAGSNLTIDFDPGEVREVELSQAELDDALATGWFELVHDPLDHDDNGTKGGAKKPDGDSATADEIVAAIGLLDPKDDAHWTAAGLPAVEAVAAIAEKPVTRAAITEAAPDAKRPE